MTMNTDPPGWTGLSAPDSERWSVLQRLEFIENTVYWRGRINRSDLVQQYQISLPQASADLAKYKAIAAGGVIYDPSVKSFVATESFKPTLTKPNADRFLLQMLGWRRGILQRSDLPPDEPPPFDELPVPRRKINPDVLRAVTQAISHKKKISVSYQSMTRPATTWREISPHSLAFDRQRWHVRAYCHERHAFRDFVLTRIFGVRDIGPSDISPSTDAAWNIRVTVQISPHPGLTDDQKRAIQVDYDMKDSVAELSVRAAMLFYLMRAMRWTGTNDRPAIEQQVIVVNRKEVEDAMKMYTPDFRSS
jgi:hypothetical protein